MKQKNLDRFFNPRSVAVIGASTNPQKVGAIVLKNILESGFRGAVYPINPKATHIEGLRAFATIGDVPEQVDMAVIATPASTVLTLLDELGRARVENVVVLTAGFGELGAEGRKLEDQVREKIGQLGMNVLGPNCLGFVNALAPINTTFGQLMRTKGNFMLLSQSGAIATSIFDWCESSEIDIAQAVTLGNKIDLTENEILDYWAQKPLEPGSKQRGMSGLMPIGMYLESINQGRDFVRACRKLAVSHPLFLLKPGRSQAAQKAMQSHTGALAGEDDVLEAALREAGVIRYRGIEDFFDLTKAFCFEKPPGGPRIAVLSNAGGPAVITADVIAEHGLTMATLSEETRDVLQRVLPREAALLNPIDVLGDAMADRYQNALIAVLSEKNVDGVVVVLTPQVMTQIEETAQVIGKLSYRFNKPILCAFIGGSRVAMGERVLNRYRIPVFRYPERAIYAFSAMWEWEKNKRRLKESAASYSKEVEAKLAPGENYGDVLRELKRFGIKTPAMVRVTSLNQAMEFCKKYPSPFALKIIAPKLLHKKEFDAVKLNIATRSQLERAWHELNETNAKMAKKHNIQGDIYIQKQVSEGVELLVGIKTDAHFGRILTVAAGGSMAELLKDKQLAMLPISKKDIRRMLQKLKLYPLLSGFRGEAAYDIDKLIELIERFGAMVGPNSTIQEAESNPVIVNRNGTWAVDVKVLYRYDAQKP